MALCAEVAGTLRDDLHILVISVTLEAVPVADMLNALQLRSKEWSFEMTLHWLDKPLGKTPF